MARYLRCRESIDIAIGKFAAPTPAAVIGEASRYVLRIANVSDKLWEIKVTIEVSALTATGIAALPAMRVAKHCAMPPRCVTKIECHYDWQMTVVFMIDGVASPAEAFWTGTLNTNQRYVVSATLRDRAGKPLDTLSIYQELQG